MVDVCVRTPLRGPNQLGPATRRFRYLSILAAVGRGLCCRGEFCSAPHRRLRQLMHFANSATIHLKSDKDWHRPTACSAIRHCSPRRLACSSKPSTCFLKSRLSTSASRISTPTICRVRSTPGRRTTSRSWTTRLVGSRHPGQRSTRTAE